MYVVEYRYGIFPNFLREFKEIQSRVYEIYKANGVMYHIILVDEEESGEITEIMMFKNEEAFMAYEKATESNLELYSLTQRFSKMVDNSRGKGVIKFHKTLFDSDFSG